MNTSWFTDNGMRAPPLGLVSKERGRFAVPRQAPSRQYPAKPLRDKSHVANGAGGLVMGLERIREGLVSRINLCIHVFRDGHVNRADRKLQLLNRCGAKNGGGHEGARHAPGQRILRCDQDHGAARSAYICPPHQALGRFAPAQIGD